jgi:predicted dithiol-disulfide oxidoreductase (DUF899 family)
VNQQELAGHSVVGREEWVEARMELLAREKELTKLREALAEQRRALPWERVTKDYVFEGPHGEATLGDLFESSSQLIVYHFMFDPAWDAGCPSCSFWADNFEGALVHLRARDVSLVAVSRAPYELIAAYKQRMGWSFPWVSSAGTDFNYDYNVSFTPESLAGRTAIYNYGSTDPGFEDREGLSTFLQTDAGDIVHTYSAYARGIDMVNGTYQFLDLVPKGRDEPADSFKQFWVRRHDEYDG